MAFISDFMNGLSALGNTFTGNNENFNRGLGMLGQAASGVPGGSTPLQGALENVGQNFQRGAAEAAGRLAQPPDPLFEQLMRNHQAANQAAPAAQPEPSAAEATQGWQNPALQGMPGFTAQSRGGNLSPLGPAVPSNMGNVDWNRTAMSPIRDSAGNIAGYGSQSFNVGLGNRGTGNDTIDRLMGMGTYAGYLPGQYQGAAMLGLSPEQRFQVANQIQQTGIQQQAENRLGEQLRGFQGPDGRIAGSAELAGRGQTLAEQQHSFLSNQAVANMNTYRQWLAQRTAAGQPPPTQEESQQFLARLPQGGPGLSPLTPGGTTPTGATPPGNPTPLGPGFTVAPPAGSLPVNHPWAAMQNQLDTTFNNALRTLPPQANGQPAIPDERSSPAVITQFISTLRSNGVQITPQNLGAITAYLTSKLPASAVRSFVTGPLLGVGSLGESPETVAARIVLRGGR